MDVLLDCADEYVLDNLYSKILSTPAFSGNNTFFAPTTAEWTRDNDWRIVLSLSVLVTVGGWFFYLAAATFSYYFIFDHDTMNHPKFLKNQVRLEIDCAVKAVPGFALLTVPWFWGEVKGYSKLYDGMPSTTYEWLYFLASMPLFLFFTDCGIYLVHRALHSKLLYKHLHKPHHKWIVPTPFASHAFHPLDGYFQSVPYHLYVYLFPMQKWQYIFMFVFVNCWTVMIHDGNFISRSTVINTTAHHTVHHLYFNYNYGQYFTFWDRLGGSHREPTEEQYNDELRSDKKVWAQQAKEAESIEAEVLRKRNKQKSN
ncbi:hypothetical protein K492DRAFT_211874 [Lichtheimia hyalospora FSU 10163]|nr:hypothetical protein K492DRAFT_211874 [Lichtheimia hyalospora FSU 10163]